MRSWQIQSISSDISDICETSGVSARFFQEEPKVEGKEGMDYFWTVDSFFKDNKVRMGLSLYNNRIGHLPKFHVWTLPASHDCDVEFIDLQPVYVEDREEALGTFRDFVYFLKNNQVPEDRLPKYKVWEHKAPPKFPSQFESQLPLFSMLEGFELMDRGGKVLKANRNVFPARWEETLTIEFSSPAVIELIRVTKGQVSHKSTRDRRSCYEDVSHLSTEQLVDWVFRSIQESLTGDIENIPKYKTELKRLPWQRDLQSVYEL